MQKNRNPKIVAGGGVQGHPPAIHSRHPDHPEHPVTPRGRPAGTVLGYQSCSLTVTDVWSEGDTLRLTTPDGATEWVCGVDFESYVAIADQAKWIYLNTFSGTGWYSSNEVDEVVVYSVNSAAWLKLEITVGTGGTVTNGIPVYA